MQLYTVRFTTQTQIKRFDAKGKTIVSEEQINNPICMTALPYKTAMSYSGCDNFVIEEYEMEQMRVNAARPKADNAWAGTAAKKSERGTYEEPKTRTKPKITAKTAKSGVQNAAETGDMSAAINQ